MPPMAALALPTNPPAVTTGVLRYDWQIACCKALTGRVLNVGCNEDPSNLRRRFGNRVRNCDMEGWDEHMNRPNHVDEIWSAIVFPWPHLEDTVELVVLGDILEHFPPEKMIAICSEARRVGRYLCVTVPEDTRIDEAHQQSIYDDAAYNLHTTVVTRAVIDDVLDAAGWEVLERFSGNWGFGGADAHVRGWCVLATRAVTEPAQASAAAVPIDSPVESEMSASAQFTGELEPALAGA